MVDNSFIEDKQDSSFCANVYAQFELNKRQ